MSLITKSPKELWDTWNIKGLIILSLLVQSFLILFVPLRKQRGGKWDVIKTGIWMAYLFADWVAIFTIGLILHAKSSDIQTLWAPFLLLHLGGPDAITSFSLEDNELWIRHLLGLLLQIGSTTYIIFLSLSNDNKLWLPTLLVLIAGIIKYAERNYALYLGSFDHFGNNWKEVNADMPSVPGQFFMLVSPRSSRETIEDQEPTIEFGVYLFGIIKSLLVGPPLISFGKFLPPNNLDVMLQAMEISLSLLYELLHTKLPVVDSKIGYVCRIVNLGCLLGALVSFSLLKKHHYKLFDIWLTYGLLIGALVLDLISIMFLISSDWITIAHFQKKRNSPEFINKRRWSNSIPQLNIFSTCYHLSEEGGLTNSNSFDILGLRSQFKKLRRNSWVKFELFGNDQEWQFIFATLQDFKSLRRRKDKVGLDFNEMKELFKDYSHSTFKMLELISSSPMNLGHMESLLMWHIVTEYYYQEEVSDPRSSPAPSSAINYRRICKLLSDYMFYLLMIEPSMIAASPNSWKTISWKTILEGAHPIILDWLNNLKTTASANLNMLQSIEKQITVNINSILGNDDETRVKETRIKEISGVMMTAFELVDALKVETYRWEKMAKVWVCILWYATISSQSVVHARQVSKGGQLLTLVWLLVNYMGLGSTPSSWFSLLL